MWGQVAHFKNTFNKITKANRNNQALIIGSYDTGYGKADGGGEMYHMQEGKADPD